MIAALNFGLPLALAEAFKKPAPTRSKAGQAAITAYWKEQRKLSLVLVKNQLPLAPDPGVVERAEQSADRQQAPPPGP